jgi:hypothetical protein
MDPRIRIRILLRKEKIGIEWNKDQKHVQDEEKNKDPKKMKEQDMYKMMLKN